MKRLTTDNVRARPPNVGGGRSMSPKKKATVDADARYFRSDQVAERDPLEQFDKEHEQAYGELPRVNILLTGQTGVGKSTLINSVLRSPVARTGVGKPVTEHIRSWSVEGVPLTLYDTPGIELGKQAKSVAKEFNELIRSQLEGDQDDHIHLIWHCVAAESKRIQDYEVELIRTLSERVPTIIVLTQCLGPDDLATNEFAKALTGVIGDNKLDVAEGSPLLTLALPRRVGQQTIEPFGLDQLVRLSYRLLPEGVRRAFINAQGVVLELKATEAREVVLWASAVAAGIGAVPIPIPDAGPLLALQAAMLARITAVMGVDLDKDTRGFLLKNVLGTGAMAAIGRQASSFLLKFVPVAGPVINAGVAAALTGALGEAFTRLVSEILRRQAEGRPMPQAEMLDVLLEEFKRQYTHKKS
jgi:uncharacterized protein (DUF697 family)/GTP-binding protein EngB required for normal cell division